MGGRTGGWMGEWMGGWVDGWMDGRIRNQVYLAFRGKTETIFSWQSEGCGRQLSKLALSDPYVLGFMPLCNPYL